MFDFCWDYMLCCHFLRVNILIFDFQPNTKTAFEKKNGWKSSPYDLLELITI